VAAVAGAGSGAGGGGSGNSSRPIASERPGTIETRKRNSYIAGLDNSPGSVESAEIDGTESGQQQEEERRHPVKRACNECRQQKVSQEFTFSINCRYAGLQLNTFTDCIFSFGAMSSKTLSPSARDVADSISPARFKRTSSAWARGLAMRKWKER
jgi:hypothetical protein